MKTMVCKQARWAWRFATLPAALVASAPAFAGTITGGLAFPGDVIPELTVVAVEQASGKQYRVETLAGQRSYRIDVAPGRYIVFAVPHGPGVEDEPGETPLRGAYSTFSLCVLNTPERAAAGQCEEHQLLIIEVGAKDTRRRVDLYDWYLPEEEKARVLAIKPDAR
jgi:hypothetical protein